ncbi:DUF819 domain-containing protein [Microbulbifer flavimaris]|uniref:DUF819 domain-containing protein n=1 Tax=Microbulbifer flavimaris TaxID=1781068 RepID=A0ABX4I5F8_9GAMM|nr:MULTISPECIES: DUF819 family protein [Microbulbifer]KUJ84880.1 hypothetical protein AVO43_04385 [Microbulbifer sp. ZGT114]PCO06978.1 DUF819 domain-containing protein [Microbulbifer flavimaris]
MITNDAIILGMLAAILGFVFYTAGSEHRFWKRFYRFVPALLLCYFLPSLLTTFGIIDAEQSNLYYVASRYLLPASLVLLTLSIDLKAIANLGPKALVMFLTGTLGIVIGGPIALLIMATIDPGILGVTGPEAVWRGMTTVAGSWIGGGANQTAMKEIFSVGDQVFSAMVAVDVIVANIWMAVLLVMAGNAKQLDARRGADTSAITTLREKVETLQKKHSRIPSLPDMMLIAAVGFGVTAIAHAFADQLAPWFQANAPHLARFSFTSQFFWLIIIATTLGVAMAFSPASKLEGAGASKIGSVFIYFLVATIGTKMDITALRDSPELFVLGAIWMSIHAGLMLLVAKLIKAPTFFMAVGSQANVGGAASAPVVAAAFHPSLAPVGVLLAVFGYALGTYAAWFCGQLLRVVGGS